MFYASTLLLLLLFLLLNYFTDMFHICMIQWNNNKYEYEKKKEEAKQEG